MCLVKNQNNIILYFRTQSLFNQKVLIVFFLISLWKHLLWVLIRSGTLLISTHNICFQRETRLGSRWHAIANPHASRGNCPCTTQHSFKQPGKILLVCYSTHHSLQFDMPHDHVVRNLNFDPAPSPKSHPKGCSWGHKVNPIQYVLHLSLLSICAHFRIKIFKIDSEIGNC